MILAKEHSRQAWHLLIWQSKMNTEQPVQVLDHIHTVGQFIAVSHQQMPHLPQASPVQQASRAWSQFLSIHQGITEYNLSQFISLSLMMYELEKYFKGFADKPDITHPELSDSVFEFLR